MDSNVGAMLGGPLDEVPDTVVMSGGLFDSTPVADLMLVRDVVSYQRRSRLWWLTYPQGMADCRHLGEPDGWLETYVVNEDGNPTMIPCYDSYVRTWRNAGWICPFDFYWPDYDKNNTEHVYYVELVLESLTEQITMWEADPMTRASLVFICFVGFADSIRRIIHYDCGEFKDPAMEPPRVELDPDVAALLEREDPEISRV